VVACPLDDDRGRAEPDHRGQRGRRDDPAPAPAILGPPGRPGPQQLAPLVGGPAAAQDLGRGPARVGRPAGQCPQQRPGRRALLRVLGQGRVDQPEQAPVEAVEVGVGVHHPVGDAGRLAAAERQPPGPGEGDHRAPGEDVGLGPDRLALVLLGSHEGRGALAPAGGVEPGRDAEVDHPRPDRAQDDVGRLQVAVHDPGGVDGGQRPGHPDGQPLEAGRRQRSSDHDLLQRRALDVLAGHPGHGRVQVGVEDRGGAEAGHPAGRADLLAEALAQLGLAVEVGPDRLDRDPGAVRGGAQVDDAHAALPDPPGQGERAEPGWVAGAQRPGR
jgi:hypothetical protein